MARLISEEEFLLELKETLKDFYAMQCKAVTGPGRSGAIAAVYASHLLRIPFIPYRTVCPDALRPLLIIDTARKTGKTLRQAERFYGEKSLPLHVFDEPPRLRFWYEAIRTKEFNCQPLKTRSPSTARMSTSKSNTNTAAVSISSFG